MGKIIFATVLFFVFMAAANCAPQKDIVAGDFPAKPAPTAEKKDEKQPDEALQRQIEQIASLAKGRVGMRAEILETEDWVSLNRSERFPMQSVYKLPIGMAVLRHVGEGRSSLEQSVRVEKSDFVRPGQRSPIRDKFPNGTELSLSEVLRLAVSESDGTASDVLLNLVGGPQAVQAYLDELGIHEIIVANSEKEFGADRTLQYRNWASPDGAVQLLRTLHERRDRLTEQNRALLLKFMTESPTGPKRLKGLLPPGTSVAHKTGTSGTVNGITAATNDIGIIKLPNNRHAAIAVFVADSPADEKTREQVIAKIARAVWDKWSR